MIFPKGIDNSQNRVYNINRDEQMFDSTKTTGAARCGGSSRRRFWAAERAESGSAMRRPRGGSSRVATMEVCGQGRAVRQGDRERRSRVAVASLIR